MSVKKRGRHNGSTSSQKHEIKTLNSNATRPEINKDKNKKALIVAQEIKIARLLANNDKKVRDKVLKRLNKWLTVRSQSSFVFTQTDFMSLWKGLFYCMWMSDKMMIQEELAESLSKLVHCLKSKDTIILYTSCALQTLATEWFGIDQYRLDKFSMLVRRILRQTFTICKNQSWNMEWVVEISQMFKELLLNVKTGLGFNLHLTEIYLEELAKVSNGNVPENVVHEFIKPFGEYLVTTNDERQMKHIMRHIFRYLIFQSDVGLDYIEKFKAWKSAGFPCTHIDDVQKVEVSDTEEYSDNETKQFFETEMQNEIKKPLDPRAGRVDVELPQIPFNAAKIVELLTAYKFHPLSTAKSRRQLLRLIHEYTELSQGRMPLGVKRIRKPNYQKGEMDSRKAALRLIQFEKGLFSDNVNKKERKRKRSKTIYDEVSTNNSKNEDILDLESNAIASNSKSLDTTQITNANLQDVDTNKVPLKKRKRSDSMGDTSNTEIEINENKKKLRIKTSKTNKSTSKLQKNKYSQIKSCKEDNGSVVDKSIKNKVKKKIIYDKQTSDNLNQCTSVSPICNDKISLKKIKKSKTIKPMLANEHQDTLRKEPLCKIKKQANLNTPRGKKKVIFGLSQNTAQHTSDYIKQVRKSPGIPFDASRKPSVSVLKMNPIPSLLNPFYKK